MSAGLICVFCGSLAGQETKFNENAKKIGTLLGRDDFDVIYGGARTGLMGIMAQAAIDEGSEVIGVIPDFLKEREVALETLPTLIETDSLQDRIQIMVDKADAYLVLPGGVGTLHELMLVLTIASLGESDKPIVLYDLDNFWQPFVALIDDMAEKGFLYPGTRSLLHFATTPEAAVELLKKQLTS